MIASTSSAQSQSGNAADVLRRLDRNGDGVLQPSEVPQQAKALVQRIAERSGQDANKGVTLSRLSPSDQGEGESRRGDDGDRRDRRDRRDNDDDDERRGRNYVPDAVPIKVPSFGVEALLDKVPGFDVPHSVTSQRGPSLAQLAEQHDHRYLEYAQRLVQRGDKNKNGIIDPDEWSNVRWRGNPNEFDLNKDARLTVAELVQGFVTRRERERNENGRSSRGRNERDDANEAKATERENNSKARDDQNDQQRLVDAQRSRAEAEMARAQAEETKKKVARFVSVQVKRYDRNKNGVLEKEEYAKMPRAPREADADGDGVLTEEEIVNKWSEGAIAKANEAAERAAVQAKQAESARNNKVAATEVAAKEQKKFRLRTSAEQMDSVRLPGWFRTRDKDTNGNVSMAEYINGDVSDRRIKEFARYDHNEDGVISIYEAQPKRNR